MVFPLDVLQHLIFPNLFDRDILKYFKGDPETGNLILKDGINAPHLSIESQLYNIIQLRKTSHNFRACAPNPLAMSFTDKIKFAKQSLANYPTSSKIKRKLVYKIANRIKPCNLYKLYLYVKNSYDNKMRILKRIVLDDIIKTRPVRFNFGNINCLGCDKDLPLYQPSIKENWERAIVDGYDPKYLLKQTCSSECLKKCQTKTLCSWCHKRCKPGTEFWHSLSKLNYSSLYVNPQTREASAIKKVEHNYISNRLCSRQCQKIINREHNTLCDKYFIVRNLNIENPSGFLVNNEIIQDLTNNLYTIQVSATILNPNAPDFVGNL
jgi:hypothetical protein